MALKTLGRTTHHLHSTRSRAPALKVQLFYVLLVVPLLSSSVNEAAAWKDEGHMLVAAIARELMKPTTLTRVEGVLQMWKNQYPTTSTLESASVWLDHLACKQAGDYCNFARQDGIQLFKTWHYCSVPWNPQNVPLRLIDKVLPLPIGGADWALHLIYASLRGCTGDTSMPKLPEKRGAGGRVRRRSRYKRRRPFRRFRIQTRASAGAKVGQQREQPRGNWATAAEKHQQKKHCRRTKEATITRGTSDLVPSDPVPNPTIVSADLYTQAAAEEAGVAKNPRHFFAAETAGSLRGHSFGMLSTAGGVCSILSYSLYLRILIHIFADIHQPLHASEVFSKVFPRGDYGGNKIYVIPPGVADEAELTTVEQRVESTSTLHGEWDSVFGQYPKFFHHIDMKELRDEAKRLVQKYPMEEKARKTFSDFVAIIRESHQYVRDFVYSEFDWTTFSYDFLPYKPSEAYVAKARQIGEERITLAGTRLAHLLDSIAEFLPRRPLSSLPTLRGECPATVPRNLEDKAASAALPLSGTGTTGTGLNVLAVHHVKLGLKETTDLIGNTNSSDDGDGDQGGEEMLSSKRYGTSRQEQGTGMASAALAATFPSAVAASAVLLLLVFLLAAVGFAWEQVRLYKRALQVVLRGEAATEVCSRAAAAAEVGDWKNAAALLRAYGEGGGEPSNAHDGVVRFSGISTSRLLTT